jgi:hypothetical protein
VSDAIDHGAHRGREVSDWLLYLLHFAISRNAQDKIAVISAATELDAACSMYEPLNFTFFRRTTEEVCRALLEKDHPRRRTILETHARHIEDERLRASFRAACLQEKSPPRARKHRQNRLELFRGLPTAKTLNRTGR